MKQRYKYWSRDDLFKFMRKQAEEHGVSVQLVRLACYDDRWNPSKEFNGCNFVQDRYHPFLPCFIHDWRWICYGYQKKWDEEFKDNLLKLGFSKFSAMTYYIAVRCAWLLYFKWLDDK